MPLCQAYKKAFPKSKATKASCSTQGRVYYNWYEENCADERKAALKDCGLDFALWAEKLKHLLNAKVTKQVTITESFEDADGVIRMRDMKSLKEFEDNGTQVRAEELLGDVIGARKEAAEDVAMLIIYRVGDLTKFKRKLRDHNGEDSKEKTE